MPVVNIHDAKARLSELVRRVEQGEEVLLARRNRPIVRLALVEADAPRRRRGTWAGEITLADDFDAPLPDFDGYQ